MEYEVACICGKVVSVSEGLAGSTTFCACGRTIHVPGLRELRKQAITDAAPSPVPCVRLADEPPPGPDPLAEILAPTQLKLRTERGGEPGKPVSVVAALSTNALWIQDVWQIRQVPLQTLRFEARRNGQELVLTSGSDPFAETVRLTFAGAAEGNRWYRELEARQHQPSPGTLPGDLRLPEGVALVGNAPDVPHLVLGRVAFSGASAWCADRGLQLRAAMRGADAVIELERRRRPEMGWGARHVSGLAIRVEDADSRQRLRLVWFSEAVCSLFNRMLLLLIIQAVLLFLVSVFWAGRSGLEAPTGQTPAEALPWAGLGVGALLAWPLVLLALLRLLRGPQFLRAAGLAVLATTTGRVVTVWLTHLLAIWTTGAPLASSKIWIMADPVDWAFVIIGVVLCVRAWRLAGDARHILPPEVQPDSTARKAWARGLLAATAVFALALLGFVATARYQASAHVLQPGVDVQREQQALEALNEGVAQFNRGELEAAEKSLQRSLRLWEELTARRSAPSVYRANLATTLYDLGLLRQRQNRADEAEKYFARAVAIADELAGDPNMDDEFNKTMAMARTALSGLRGDKSSKLLDEKDLTAARKYEEAQVKAAKAPAEAEALYVEAIALWEEVLPQAANPEYQKAAALQLSLSYLHVAEIRQQSNKRPEAEAAIHKAIDYGEKAVALDPNRPLAKHNLAVARDMLDRMQEQAFQDEISMLCDAHRYGDAVERFSRSIEEQEEQAPSAKDRAAAEQRLAYRLDRYAWFLAHCPDERFRDTKAAVKRARRATELQQNVGDFWYTLAMVQYRNGDWKDSLATLDQVKAAEGEFDASAWLLVAMNRYQLKQPADARAALRKAKEWMAEQERMAEGNALLRFRLEMQRPHFEDLRREAEKLIEGKDPGGVGVG